MQLERAPRLPAVTRRPDTRSTSHSFRSEKAPTPCPPFPLPISRPPSETTASPRPRTRHRVTARGPRPRPGRRAPPRRGARRPERSIAVHALPRGQAEDNADRACAEVAAEVVDRLQRRGLGSHLVRRLGAASGDRRNRALHACQDPTFARVALQEAPSVLGWRRWREIDAKYSMGLITGVLSHAMPGRGPMHSARRAARAPAARRARRGRPAVRRRRPARAGLRAAAHATPRAARGPIAANDPSKETSLGAPTVRHEPLRATVDTIQEVRHYRRLVELCAARTDREVETQRSCVPGGFHAGSLTFPCQTEALPVLISQIGCDPACHTG